MSSPRPRSQPSRFRYGFVGCGLPWALLACAARTGAAPASPPEAAPVSPTEATASAPEPGALVLPPPPPLPPGGVGLVVSGDSIELGDGEAQANAIYMPQPDAGRLAAAGPPDAERATIVMAYCIATNGKPEQIHVAEVSPGAEGLAEVCREAMTRWRFKPFIRDLKAVRACTKATFNVKLR